MLVPPLNILCACSNDVLRFTCMANVMGVGATIWTGTAFNCNGNEILLRHSKFSEPGGTLGQCNGGAISARSVGVENNCYSSELSVRLSPGLNNRTIRCVSNSNDGMSTIAEATISLVTGIYIMANEFYVCQSTTNGS